MRRKITVVGAGNVGSSTAQRIADKGYADVVLVDIVEGLPQGRALDILEAGPITGSDSNVTGTNSYEETSNSDIAIITSGMVRKPGMSRDDLLLTNMKIVGSVTRQVAKYSPDCIIIAVTNPLDAMCHVAYEASGFPRHRVIGMAGILDTTRFRTFLARELKVSVDDIVAYVLGGHGDTMVPLTSYSTVAGVPIAQLLPKDTLERIIQRTRDGGAEIVNLIKTGSAYFGPSAAVAQIVEAILFDKKRILPCSAYLQGEYGFNDIFIGVPVKLGAHGIEEIIELKLTHEENIALSNSAAAMIELVEVIKSSAAR